jgi:two-component system CheB/CheR fusion protein
MAPARRKSQKSGSSDKGSGNELVLPNVNPAVAGRELRPDPSEFLIVGIGASAGGLDSLLQLLGALPNDTGMAFVVVQHLDPGRSSALSELLDRGTGMPVVQAGNNMEVQPNHVYVIPPNKDMVFGDGLLQLGPRTEIRGEHRSIDRFLRSLAEAQADRAIGVILSGAGSDGSQGIEEIKAAGGLTFAQDNSAEFGSMPRHAVATGAIDFVLPPAGIAAELARIAKHPYVGRPADTEEAESTVRAVLEAVRTSTGVDFTQYKRNTLQRRINRRMVLHRLARLQEYVEYLKNHSEEAEALYQDILIGVTSFFRNPDAYEALKATVFPQLTENKSRHHPVRVWTVGCATGEEAYSIAMAYTEYCEASGRRVPMQIFATDLNAAGIERARTGVYSKGILQDVSPERLRRFFIEVDGNYRICKPVRDMCIFARQNMLADPPFSRLDLVACRNVLIYMDTPLQRRLLPVLHYALQPNGFLWLGNSETIGSYRELFEVEDAKHKIYRKRTNTGTGVVVPVQRPSQATTAPVPARTREAGDVDPQREADRIVLSRYAPPGVVLNADLEILQFRGETRDFLSPAPGRASLNLLKMLREGLLVAVRGVAHKALREQIIVREDGLRVRTDAGTYREAAVVAIPIKPNNAAGAALLLLFESAGGPAPYVAPAEPPPPSPESTEDEVRRLRQDLAATREYLQSVIEQQEAANEELQSANEEVQSANEELQSINEELETSKEEIQSSNEELATVNDELQNRNNELAQSNNDLINLVSSSHMAIVILGRDLRLRRFTPAAERLLNLIPADVGRPISDIKLRFNTPDIEQLLIDTIDSVTPKELEVRDQQGRWYSLRLRPYLTLENKIDGAVMMLIDIDALKRIEEALRESESRFKLMADSAPVLIWVHGLDGYQFVNRAYLEFLAIDEADALGPGWTEHIHPQDRDAYMSAYLEAFARHVPFQGQCRLRRADGIYRWMKTIALPRTTADGQFLGYVGSTTDVSDLKEAEARLLIADRHKDEFMATLAHELRNPLAAIRNAVQVIEQPGIEAQEAERARLILGRQSAHMVRLVDDLLDASRIALGTVQLQRRPTNVATLLRDAVESSNHMRSNKGQMLELSLPQPEPWVNVDSARIEQVLNNLLHNASKFTPRGGRISVSLEREVTPAPGLLIRVRDNGEGMDAETLARVFELFVQGDGSAARAGAGIGIGLALARHIMQLHGGALTAHSDGRGQGSEFQVRLAEDAQPATERQRGIVAAGGRRILVVDDNIDAADAIQALLKIAGHRVSTCNDARRAVDLALEQRPEVILLDTGMPGMDGYEVARRLRQQGSLDETLIVGLSGFSSEEHRSKSRQAGFDEQLIKPLNLDNFHDLLERRFNGGG